MSWKVAASSMADLGVRAGWGGRFLEGVPMECLRCLYFKVNGVCVSGGWPFSWKVAGRSPRRSPYFTVSGVWASVSEGIFLESALTESRQCPYFTVSEVCAPRVKGHFPGKWAAASQRELPFSRMSVVEWRTRSSRASLGEGLLRKQTFNTEWTAQPG